jgi:hypothetical protein
MFGGLCGVDQCRIQHRLVRNFAGDIALILLVWNTNAWLGRRGDADMFDGRYRR